MVQYVAGNFLKPGLYVSISGKNYEKVELTKDALKEPFDLTLLLNYIQKMTNDGWRIIGTPSAREFILEKKRN